MTQPTNLQLRQEACRRAHWYGAEAVILEKEAEQILKRAKEAKRRYFGELANADRLAGRNSPFEVLA